MQNRPLKFSTFMLNSLNILNNTFCFPKNNYLCNGFDIPHENPIPTTKVGNYLWVEIKGVEIVEIIDYHNE